MLDICKTLFENLNSQGIKYCHWKSNLYLDRSLAGKTDLDLLVHANDKDTFEELLDKLLIKRIISPAEKRFDGMDDFLGFDHIAGELIHLHVHYRLILGQRYIKNHHLPIEDLIFQNLTVKDNINIPCPEIELFLLIIRAHMKVDLFSLIKHGIKGPFEHGYTAFPADIEKELSDLISRSNVEKLKEILKGTRLPLAEQLFTQFIKRFVAKDLKFNDIIQTQQMIFSGLKGFRRNKGVGIYLKYIYMVIKEILFNYMSVTSKKKKLPGVAKVISIVGADGSGKSTLVGDLNKWLSWKMSVRNYYHGIPKTNIVKMMSFAIYGFNKLRLSFIANYIDCRLWVYIAKKRYDISVLSHVDSGKGDVVITDRLPMKEFENMKEPMDGPRLQKNSTGPGRHFSIAEMNYYNRIVPPDRIFVLRATIEELRRRKRDLDLILHKEKSEAVNAIKGNDHIVLIDANRPYSDAQLQVKRMIWEIL